MKKIILLLSIFILTSCSNYHELESLSIVSSIRIDYKDKYDIKIEIDTQDKIKYIEGYGKTLSEAFNNINTKSNNYLFYNHLNTLIITSNTNIEEIIKYFIRNTKTNNTFNIVISDNENIYDEKTNTGKYIKELLKNNNLEEYTFFNISKIYYEDSKDILIPVYNNGITSFSIYSNNTLIKELDINYLNYNNILNNINNEILNINNKVILEPNRICTKYIIKDNEIKIDINIESTIKELFDNIDTTKINNITNLEKETNIVLKKEIEKYIKILTDNDSDVLGINLMIKNKYCNDYHDFKEYNYKIKVNTHINKKGLILK